jgi:hypothetical protein
MQESTYQSGLVVQTTGGTSLGGYQRLSFEILLTKEMIPNEPVLSTNQTWRTLIPATEKHFNACREDALSFPQVRGVVESSEYIVNVDCACCGSENHAPLFIKWGFTHSECASCKHIS